MRIAVDVMGGDHAPQPLVEGALQALKRFDDIELLLIGQQEKIKKYVKRSLTKIEIIHANEIIEAHEEPVRAVRRKRDASIVKAVQLVKEKKADACISAGNTGAYMTAGLFVIGRLPGIERPALVSMLPTVDGTPVLALDVGANVDAKPSHLVQYARMGNLYAQKILGISKPSIGLLNVGTEDTKGNELMRQTFSLLKQSDLYFLGNVEAREIPFGVADIIVCDGFSGNVVLKSTEGTAQAVFSLLKKELNRSLPSRLAALTLKSGLRRMKSLLDYTEYGGAPLLGLNGICIKAHGSSNAKAIENAVRQARNFVRFDLIQLIKREVQKESEAN